MAYNATYLIRRTRELAQQFGSALQFRDGITGEAITDAAATPILPAINEYKAKLANTGFYQKSFSTDLDPSVATYSVDTDCLDILSVYTDNRSLRRTTRDAMDSAEPEWRRRTAGRPVFYIAEGNEVTLIPAPDATAASVNLQVWGKANPPDLAAGTDVITGLRSAQAIRVPYGAALIIATIDDRNAAHVARRDLYKREADELMAELAGVQDKADDATSLSLDAAFEVPAPSTGRDDR